MNKSRILSKLVSCLSMAGLIVGSFVAVPQVQAQSSSDKIELLSQALEARDEGNYTEAKRILEQLITMEPDNRNVQRMLAQVNQQLEGQPTVTYTSTAAPATTGSYVVETTGGTEQPVAATSEPMMTGGEMSATSILDQRVMAEEQARQIAESALADARALMAQDYFDEAKTVLEDANNLIPESTANLPIKEELSEERARLAYKEAMAALEDNDFATAQEAINDYEGIYGANNSRTKKMRAMLAEARTNPRTLDPEDIAGDYLAVQELVTELNRRARAHYLLGDYQGALNLYNRVLAVAPTNVEAKSFQTRINKHLTKIGQWDRKNVREGMLRDVSMRWALPKTFQAPPTVTEETTESALMQKIENLIIPNVSFRGVPLQSVADTLSELSGRFAEDGRKVNISIPDDAKNIEISLSLEELSLKRILDELTRGIAYDYEVRAEQTERQAGLIGIFKGQGSKAGETMFYEQFPISPSTRARITGGGGGGGGGGAAANPFASTGGGGGGGGDQEEVADAIRNFFANLGISFDEEGTSLAYDGTSIYVTHTRDSIDRMRDIFRKNFSDDRLVEIEAKFLEVEQGTLNELGFDWSMALSGNNFVSTTSSGSLRNLDNAFALGSQAGGEGRIVVGNDFGDLDEIGAGVDPAAFERTTIPYRNEAPTIPGQINLGAAVDSLIGISSTFGQWDLNVAIRALEQQEGSDLMTAPRVTVVPGGTAEIVVAQELRYPESYDAVDAEVDNGVAVTAGTPRDFTVRNIGVEMEVTPKIQRGEGVEDLISMQLEPIVTEFEGFIEYGGASVGIDGNTAVTVPSGFFVPIFSVRRVSTEVTMYDGATIVLGGLTREEVKTTNDSVPVLGDMPLVGRFFRSEGESRRKRNLLIFVTANLVSPGGSPAKQQVGNLVPGETFQNPILLTPGGPQARGLSDEARNDLRKSVDLAPEGQ